MNDILSALDSEIIMLKQARALLIGTTSNGASRGGSTYQTVNGPRKKRVLSPEARERIAAAQAVGEDQEGGEMIRLGSLSLPKLFRPFWLLRPMR